jgi:site-specific DNA-cytosine methylase
MKKECQDVISEYLGVQPILINSSLVSAQSRNRLYWTNIPNVVQPTDKGILLKDILETVVDKKYNLSEAKIDRVLNTQRGKGFFYSPNTHDKIGTLIAGYHKVPTDGAYIACGALRGRYYDENGKRTDHKESVAGKTTQMLEIRKDDKTNTLTTVQKDNVIVKDTIFRKLTPTECERLQTVPDGYTEGVSNTSRYKMLGNGWTVEVIKHIFRNMNELS